MIVGERLRELREERKLSQGEIQERTGLLRCYISRVENGHTIPAVETLEKFARALEVPMYQLFYDGEKPPVPPKYPKSEDGEWGGKGKDARLLVKFRRLFSRMEKQDQGLLFVHGTKVGEAEDYLRGESISLSAIFFVSWTLCRHQKTRIERGTHRLSKYTIQPVNMYESHLHRRDSSVMSGNAQRRRIDSADRGERSINSMVMRTHNYRRM
jgi:transcriptional regulator with XRE-family HTH domain